jgi:alanine racemase
MTSNVVTIDLSALRHNFKKIKQWVRPSARILCVVKADAYGHGMLPVARVLASMGADYFGVFEAEEGVALREAGIRTPTLVLKGIVADEIPAVVEYDLTPGAFDLSTTKQLSDYALKNGALVPVHIKVDTGMSRVGVPWEKVPDFINELLHMKGITPTGIFSHLCVADEPAHPFTDVQMDRFQKVVAIAHKFGIKNALIHISNSGAIVNQKGVGSHLVRPGIILYGSLPSLICPHKDELEPVMSFRSRVIQVKSVSPGTSISYGRTYIAESQRVIATIPAGYDDGYSRLLSNKGVVLIRGKRAPLVGTVCMNSTMVDVTDIEGVSTGDEVILLGRQGKDRITAEEIAEKIGTISYEIYCTIGKSNKRCYVGDVL